MPVTMALEAGTRLEAGRSCSCTVVLLWWHGSATNPRFARGAHQRMSRRAGCTPSQAPMTGGGGEGGAAGRRAGLPESEQSELVEGPRLQGWWDDVELKLALTGERCVANIECCP